MPEGTSFLVLVKVLPPPKDSAAMEALRGGCKRLGLPVETGRELYRFLLVQKFSGNPGGSFVPSSSLERLLRYVLVNTRVRCAVEAEIGKIKYAELGSRMDFSTLTASPNCKALYLWSSRHVLKLASLLVPAYLP